VIFFFACADAGVAARASAPSRSAAAAAASAARRGMDGGDRSGVGRGETGCGTAAL
jgi:hypothetical protein